MPPGRRCGPNQAFTLSFALQRVCALTNIPGRKPWQPSGCHMSASEQTGDLAFSRVAAARAVAQLSPLGREEKFHADPVNNITVTR